MDQSPPSACCCRRPFSPRNLWLFAQGYYSFTLVVFCILFLTGTLTATAGGWGWGDSLSSGAIATLAITVVFVLASWLASFGAVLVGYYQDCVAARGSYFDLLTMKKAMYASLGCSIGALVFYVLSFAPYGLSIYLSEAMTIYYLNVPFGIVPILLMIVICNLVMTLQFSRRLPEEDFQEQVKLFGFPNSKTSALLLEILTTIVSTYGFFLVLGIPLGIGMGFRGFGEGWGDSHSSEYLIYLIIIISACGVLVGILVIVTLIISATVRALFLQRILAIFHAIAFVVVTLEALMLMAPLVEVMFFLDHWSDSHFSLGFMVLSSLMVTVWPQGLFHLLQLIGYFVDWKYIETERAFVSPEPQAGGAAELQQPVPEQLPEDRNIFPVGEPQLISLPLLSGFPIQQVLLPSTMVTSGGLVRQVSLLVPVTALPDPAGGIEEGENKEFLMSYNRPQLDMVEGNELSVSPSDAAKGAKGDAYS